MDRLSTEYINTGEYKKLEDKLKNLKSVLDDLSLKLTKSRKLRYAEVDIEAERKAGRLLPDELYIPLHVIDTNVRREQSAYVQFVAQSTRAVILSEKEDPTFNYFRTERDLTTRLRYDSWQLAMFPAIDGFQSNGYSILEVVQDLDAPGHIRHEFVPFGDFAFNSDTKDIQAVEILARTYYFTRTKLLALCGDENPENPDNWSRFQVDKVLGRDPDSNVPIDNVDVRDKSLYRVYKYMFRINGIVNVAWGHPDLCDDWLRIPRPLFLGRREVVQQPVSMVNLDGTPMPPQQTSVEAYEKDYPYILMPYLISENDTISQSKGRIYMDQDMQEAVSSLMSSTVTQARRAAGLYFSKEVSDPNDDLMLQKNIFFRSGCVINSKVSQFQLASPDPSMFGAINMLVTANQNETSQVNFAANNRKDSRKTAEEIRTAKQEEAQLSTVQVVLFAIALTKLYTLMCSIIKSRVLAGLITDVPEDVKAAYARNWTVSPSGVVDVIERQQLTQTMMASWPVVQTTPCATQFLIDLLRLLFADRAESYVQAIVQAQQQAQSAQAQQMQQMMNFASQIGEGITRLSKSPEMFSETGKIHALPSVKIAAEQIGKLQEQLQPNK